MSSPDRNTVVDQLEREWAVLAQHQLAQDILRWRSLQTPLRRFEQPRQLLRFLHGAHSAQTDEPLLALLVLAAEDRTAGRFVLQAILPALKAQAKRLIGRTAPADEVWELLLFYAWQAICTYPCARRRCRVAANLVLQVLHDTTRELREVARHRQTLVLVDPLDLAGPRLRLQTPAAAPSPRPRVVRAAVQAGVIRRRDAALILRTRVRNADLQRVARESGVSYVALRKRRRRAEQALRLWLPLQGNVPNRPRRVLTSSGPARVRMAGRASRQCHRRRPDVGGAPRTTRPLTEPKEGS